MAKNTWMQKNMDKNKVIQENQFIPAILFFFICLFLYTKFVGPLPFSINSVQTTKTSLFQVQGDGKATEIPNTALISFGVTKQAATVADAQNQTNTTINAILDAIKQLGIDTKNITTTNYSIYPNYDYTTGKQTANGYTVSQDIELKLSPVEKASKAVDIVTANGASNVGGITFTLDDQSQKQLQDKARKMAIDAAKQKAESLASLAGIHLGRIVDVQENINTPIPIRYGAGLNKAPLTADSTPTQLPTGETTINTTVTLSYETY